ncbi:MAG: hypothetical protein MGU50_07760 [Trichodesmium sp. MAG_R02]|nr:hypothetical protein [Trichodesmium sp. MAG_R02]
MNQLIILVRGGSRRNFIHPQLFLVFLELPNKAIAHRAKTIFRTHSVSSSPLILTKPEQ